MIFINNLYCTPIVHKYFVTKRTFFITKCKKAPNTLEAK